MKQILITLLMLVSASFGVGATEPEVENGNGPTTNTIPIPVRKDKDDKGMRAPAKEIWLSAVITNGTISLDVPFEEFPLTVEIENVSNYGYWSGVMSENLDAIPFDGVEGEYSVTLTTAGNSTYTGYFTLE